MLFRLNIAFCHDAFNIITDGAKKSNSFKTIMLAVYLRRGRAKIYFNSYYIFISQFCGVTRGDDLVKHFNADIPLEEL